MQTFLYDDAGPRLQRSREEGARAEPVGLAPLPAGKGDLIPDFVSAVEEDRDLTAETQAAFDAVSACLAADGALRSGRPNRIEYA